MRVLIEFGITELPPPSIPGIIPPQKNINNAEGTGIQNVKTHIKNPDEKSTDVTGSKSGLYGKCHNISPALLV